MAEKNKFVVIEEKRKGRPQRKGRYAFVAAGVIFLLLSWSYLSLCFMMTDCNSASNSPSELELTATKLLQMNATTVVQITETADAILGRASYHATVTSDSAAIIITFMYLDQNHTPFALLTEMTSSATATTTATTTTATTTTATTTTATATATMPMSFSWATQDLPEVSAAAQAAFEQVDILRDVTVRAEAYGENCSGCSASSFLAMTTDFYLNAEVDSLSDLEAIAELVTAAVDVLSAPLGVELPARLGYFDITFTAGDAVGNLRIMFDQIEAARAEGLTGSALINELGGIIQRP